MALKIGLIGCGNLGAALAEGLSKKPGIELFLFDTDIDKAQSLAKQIQASSCDSIGSLVSKSDLLILAIKPKDFLVVLADLAKSPSIASKLIVSVAAGVTSDTIYTALGVRPRLIRTMPNLASFVGLGVTGVWGSQAEDIELVCNLFAVLGKTVVVAREEDLDTVTGLSGSGPAFVFSMLSGMIEGAVAKGLEREQAEALAVATLKGAAVVFEQAHATPDELIARVASPGGTTQAGLAVLNASRTKAAYSEAVIKATERASEIGQETYSQLVKK